MLALCLFEQTEVLLVLNLHLHLYHFLDKSLVLAYRNTSAYA